MSSIEQRLALLEEMLREGLDQGLILRTPDDEPLDGRTLGFAGAPAVNFASCSYLGLELDPRMRMAVCAAVMRYGTQFSSSRTYVQAPPYLEIEERLEQLFGSPALMMPSTTLGHVATLPVIVGSRDLVVLDQQVHHSVQMAVNHVRAQGSRVEMIRHNDLDQLEQALKSSGDHDRVWYLADGVYSMFADFAPFAALRRLHDEYEQLHLYIDDSHGVGWHGRNGRGPAGDAFGGCERVVIAASLNKSFAAAGAAIVFPNERLKQRVQLLGGPMIFSGPVQPPMLGAALASLEIHLSDELAELQAALRERIEYCNRLLSEFCVPLASEDHTPIRFIPVGLPAPARALGRKLMDDGLFVNPSTFPAVPMKQAGVRFTLTLHQRPADIRRLVEALARHLPTVADDAAGGGVPPALRPGSPARRPPALRLERHETIAALDTGEWDRMLGDRGTFSAAGLRFLERAFRDGRPEDRWRFHYYVVRDREGAPVLATWCTEALWKDDMLAPAEVSAIVERRRRTDPYYLTSTTFAVGSLLTEGDHLYLDRRRDWRGALDLLIAAIERDAAEAGARTVMVRDIDAADRELGAALHDRGFVRVALPDSYTLAPLPGDDAAWLAGLSSRARAHQRREVLTREHLFDVEFVRRGTRMPGRRELAHLHALYGNVRVRSLELNGFELPATVLGEMLEHDCWELMLLRLAGGRDAGRTVAFGAHFVGRRHYAPLLVGLDYEFVISHGAYRQALRQALLRGRALGSEAIMLGMGAPLEKRRFGAQGRARVAYVQSGDHYGQEVLADLQASTLAAR
jgi:7-keto-8-aminopelargonate synthetase-like enzyme